MILLSWIYNEDSSEKSKEMYAPLTIGNVPEKMTDPVGTKVFGIIDEILYPKGERERLLRSWLDFPVPRGSSKVLQGLLWITRIFRM